MSQTDWLVALLGDRLHIPAPIIDFLPTILLWSFTALLPLLVAYSDRWLGHYTRSEVSNYLFSFHCSNNFIYLLTMVCHCQSFYISSLSTMLWYLHMYVLILNILGVGKFGRDVWRHHDSLRFLALIIFYEITDVLWHYKLTSVCWWDIFAVNSIALMSL